METPSSNFVALLDRLRWIKRWGLKRNVSEENVMEHSWQVASICHLLTLLHNKEVDDARQLDVGQVVLAALYHDVSEVLTSDLPTPIKYFNPQMQQAFALIEEQAEQSLLAQVPPVLQAALTPLLLSAALPAGYKPLIKAADLISALIKCRHELSAGNPEFRDAHATLQQRLSTLELPGLQQFLQLFDIETEQTLDQQLAPNNSLHTLLHQHDQQVRRPDLDQPFVPKSKK